MSGRIGLADGQSLPTEIRVPTKKIRFPFARRVHCLNERTLRVGGIGKRVAIPETREH